MGEQPQRGAPGPSWWLPGDAQPLAQEPQRSSAATPPAPASPPTTDPPAGPLVGHQATDFPMVTERVAGKQPRTGRRDAVLGLLGVVALLLASLSAGYAGAWLQDRSRGGPDITVAGAEAVQRAPDSVAAVAAKVLPSVVSIEVEFPGGQGSGSGFVIDEDGYLLTNNHVISRTADSGRVVVVFADGSQEEAELVGRTTSYDLAVLKVDRGNLPALPLADSDSVVVGDPVVAVGAPLGLESTVTTGIVSALNRPVSAGEGQESAFINAIQTDAAINPGNSGGPLVNLNGEVIGINSAIARAPGLAGGNAGNIGLGFAIPSNQAARTAQEIIETGAATYPVIGVLLDRSYRGQGVKVLDDGAPAEQPIVTPQGPADRAGIEPGDVIVEFQGRPVTDPDELIVAIRAQRPGDTVELTVRRDGRERAVAVQLEEAESD